MGGQHDNVGGAGRARRAATRLRARREALARIARHQHGVVSRNQLLDLGFSAREVDNLVRSCTLRRLHRSVYLLGQVEPPLAREMAAVLACGSNAVLSHRNAAVLWGLLPITAAATPEVSVPARNPGLKPGIVIHRVVALDPRDVTKLERIPITRPARTLVDLAALLDRRELERALAEAYAKRRFTRAALGAVLNRAANAPGTAALRRALATDLAPALTRSEAEERLLGLIRKAGLPSPEVNARLERYEVDFLWPAERLVVEVDGFRYHSSRAAFERDRLRDAKLQAQGHRVMRVTWRQIIEAPEAVLVRIAQGLAVSRAAAGRIG